MIATRKSRGKKSQQMHSEQLLKDIMAIEGQEKKQQFLEDLLQHARLDNSPYAQQYKLALIDTLSQAPPELLMDEGNLAVRKSKGLISGRLTGGSPPGRYTEQVIEDDEENEE